MAMTIVGYGTITAAGGASQSVQVKAACPSYSVAFRSTGSASPAAGSTSVSWKPLGGDSITLKYDNGVAVNVDPTSPTPFAISAPLDTLYFTPSSWTANSALFVTVFGETGG